MTSPGPLARVVDGGYCIGCGCCAALDPSIRIVRDEMQRFVAVLPAGGPGQAAASACPFADGTPSEDALAADLFRGSATSRDPLAGSSTASFVGWVTEGDYRARGSSGGMASWLLCELLRRGEVDAVIHVAEAAAGPDRPPGGPLFAFRVSRTVEEVRHHAKSRYYPVELSGVLRHVLDHPARYAVVGVPCFCKALRLAARQSPTLAERLTCVVGIVCGHLKSGAFAEALAWQCGVRPSDLEAIDFRAKLPGRPASRYGLTVAGVVGDGRQEVTRPMEGLLGANWSHGLFKYRACDFCDDVLAETADVVLGDAWLPQYESDHRGTNVVLTRTAGLRDLLNSAAASGRLHLEEVPVETVTASQAGGFRHRRDGLAYRLWLADQAGRWRPAKRVAARPDGLPRGLRRVHALRQELAEASHAAFLAAKRQGDFGLFRAAMAPLIDRLERLQRPSLGRRAAAWLRRRLAALFGRRPAGRPGT